MLWKTEPQEMVEAARISKAEFGARGKLDSTDQKQDEKGIFGAQGKVIVYIY
jgi:hypothetical protein